MQESDSPDPAVRTQLNVRDSDATLLLSHGEPTGGSALTLRIARELGRPVLHLDLDGLDPETAADSLAAWLDRVRPRTLNVAGPRASGDPAIYEAARRLLRSVLSSRG